MNLFDDGIVEKSKVYGDYYLGKNNLLMCPYDSKPNSDDWHQCREVFHENFKDGQDTRFMVRPTLPIEDIARFIRYVDLALGVDPPCKIQKAKYKMKTKSDDQPCLCDDDEDTVVVQPGPAKSNAKKKTHVVRKDAICITPAPFWIDHPVKLAFLTAAIKLVDYEESIDWKRCQTASGLADYLIDIDDDQEYFSLTEFATRRFLSGHTNVCRSRKKKIGWVCVFESRIDDEDGKLSRAYAGKVLQKP